jgi:DNA polymerase III subunit epsilon
VPAMRLLSEAEFAVVDVETTGLSPKHHDRVIEVAVLRWLPDGTVTDQFVSLVNPGRDLGKTTIHGITGRDVASAPRFEDILGDVVDRLGNAVVVGHNIRFDAGFLNAECERAGCSLPSYPTLCTLELASSFLDVDRRRLGDCCEHCGIEIGTAHSAADDARACALLLQRLLSLAIEEGHQSLEDLGCGISIPTTWPQLARSGKALARTDAQRLLAAEQHYLARLVTRLTATSSSEKPPANLTAYLALLDRAMEDRVVSEEESEHLFELAHEWGLSGEQIRTAHRQYLDALVRAALADGVISDVEQSDLKEVTRLLGFDKQILNQALQEARSALTTSSTAPSDANNLAGKSVCFTGELICTIGGNEITREQAQELAAAAGLKVAGSVTKALDILVVADPHTQSGKAQKARKYGTRIMAELAFWRAIGVAVD